MKKIALAMMLTAFSPAAFAEENPVMSQYEVLANQLLEATNVAETREDVTAIQEQSKNLIELGWQVMDVYGAAFPECAEQFKVMKEELPGSETMPIPQLREKFHNAVGLPEAPKYCYYGRAMAYYPFVSIIRLNDELTHESRRLVMHHFMEAAEHLQDIRNKMK